MGRLERTSTRARRAAVITSLVLALPGTAVAVASDFENPASHDTSQQFTPPPDPTNPQRQDKPNDPQYDRAEPDGNPADPSTNLFDERFDLFGFPSALTATTATYKDGPNAIVPAVTPQISGYNAAGAWKLTRGRPDVPIAILDTGIKWDRESLRRRIHLNTGELPLPQDAGGVTHPNAPQGGYDLDGNGAVNVEDYKDDPRVTTHTSHDGKTTGQDLIHAFSNHTDSDGNGYVDDIAGWDFFDDDNDPFDASSYFAAGNHGSGRAGDAAEQANDGQDELGVCPHCQIMPLRIWDTFVSDGNTFGQAVMYATDNGAKVIEGANGSLYHSAFAEAASQYAYDHGTVQTFSGDDLNTGNHNYPANYGHAMLIQGTVPDTVGLGQNCSGSAQICSFFGSLPVPLGTNAPVATYFRGANTTQFGGKSSISMEGNTGSVNTGRASGAAGMVVSAALDHGIALRPDETREILEQTAEDVTPGNTAGTGVPDPANPGWDSHFGWGRVDLGKAVSAASDTAKIPDEAAIDSPDWYAPLTAKTLHVTGRARARFTGGNLHYKLEWGAGEAPTTWHTVTNTNAIGPVTDFGSIDLDTVRAELASFNVPPDPAGPTFSATTPNPFQHEFTVRLTVTDPTPGSTRIAGVDRRVLDALDPTAEGLRSGYPKRMGTGGEAPIRYADLDGDNVQELIVPAMDGTVHAYEPDGSELAGWPVHTQIQFSAKNHANAPGVKAVTDAGAPPREPPRAPAIADIDGDGSPEVIDTAGTHLYVWEPDGTQRAGFPLESNPAFCGPAFERQDDKHLKCGFLASPSVADLDGDGQRTDIVVAALDGHLYAIKPNGDPVAHFPVQLVDPTQVAGNSAVLAESINQVAVGDLTGDGKDDVVAGSNETYGAKSGTDVSFAGLLGGTGQSTRVYAVNGATGQFLPGWPISISGILQDTLPLIGPGQDPALLKVGDQQRVLASATSGSLATYMPNGTIDKTMRQELRGPGSDKLDNSPALNLFESAAVGKLTTAQSNPSVVKYEVSLAQAANLLLVGQNFPYNHLIGAWDSTDGAPMPAYPRVTDDYQFLSSSTVAKVDPASPANQVLAGTGLGLLHAYDGITGADAPGFPKATAGWLFSPAALSTDGRMAAITREGWLFEWGSTADACQTEWPTFRHDQQNSGNYDRDGTPPAAPGNAALEAVGGGKYKLTFKSPGDDGFCGDPTALYSSDPDVKLPAGVKGGEAVTLLNLTLTPGSVLRFGAEDESHNRGIAVELTVPAEPAPGGGGTTPGGSEPGGSTPGGSTPGGSTPGGSTPGGSTPGGSTPGGPIPGGPLETCATGAVKVPRSSISRRHSRISHRRVRLIGHSVEVNCVTGKLAHGRVKHVLVSVARRHGGRCRFLHGSGRLGRARSCASAQFLLAHVRPLRGTRKTVWTLTLRTRLPRGTYRVDVRGIDTRNRLETRVRPTNSKAFRLPR